MPEPRLIEVDKGYEEISKGQYASPRFICSKNRHPSILHVCREARHEILKLHPLCPESVTYSNYGYYEGKTVPQYSGGIPRFINHFHDVLHIEPSVFCAAFWNYVPSVATDAANAVVSLAPGGLEEWTSKSESGEFINPAGFDPFQIRRISIRTQTWDAASQILVYNLIHFPKLEELILVNEAYSRRFGKCKMVDLRRGDSIFFPQDLRPYTHSMVDEVGEWDRFAEYYKETIEAAFEEEIDRSKFEAQWGTDFNDDTTTLDTSAVKNPWLATGRTPPSIRLMRMVMDRESTLTTDCGDRGKMVLDFEGEMWNFHS